MNPTYSYKTSLGPYLENSAHKEIQKMRVLGLISQGANNLLQISEQSGILQAIVSARVNGLIKDGTVKYEGFVIFRGRKRKRIVISNPQTKLF